MSNFKTLTRIISVIMISSFLFTGVAYPAPDTTLRVPMAFGKEQKNSFDQRVNEAAGGTKTIQYDTIVRRTKLGSNSSLKMIAPLLFITSLAPLVDMMGQQQQAQIVAPQDTTQDEGINKVLMEKAVAGDMNTAHEIFMQGTYASKLQFLEKMPSDQRRKVLENFFKYFNEKKSSEAERASYGDAKSKVDSVLNDVKEMSSWIVSLFKDPNVPREVLADFEQILNTNLDESSIYYPGAYLQGYFRETSLTLLGGLIPYYESVAKNISATLQERRNAVDRLKALYYNFLYLPKESSGRTEGAKEAKEALIRLAKNNNEFARKFLDNEAREVIAGESDNQEFVKDVMKIAKENGETVVSQDDYLPTIASQGTKEVNVPSDSLPPLTLQQRLLKKLTDIAYSKDASALNARLEKALNNPKDPFYHIAGLKKRLDASGFGDKIIFRRFLEELFKISESPAVQEFYLAEAKDLQSEQKGSFCEKSLLGFSALAHDNSEINVALAKELKERYGISSWNLTRERDKKNSYIDGIQALGKYAKKQGGVKEALAYLEQLKGVLESTGMLRNIGSNYLAVEMALQLVWSTPDAAKTAIKFVQKYFLEEGILISNEELRKVSIIAGKPLPDEAFMDELISGGYFIRDILDIPVLAVVSRSPTGRNIFLHPEQLLAKFIEHYQNDTHIDFYTLRKGGSIDHLKLCDRMILMKALLIRQLIDDQSRDEIAGMIQQDLDANYAESGGNFYFNAHTGRLRFQPISSLETEGKAEGNQRHIQEVLSKTIERNPELVFLSGFHLHAVDIKGNPGYAAPSGEVSLEGDLWNSEDGIVITYLSSDNDGIHFDIKLYGNSVTEVTHYNERHHIIDIGVSVSKNPKGITQKPKTTYPVVSVDTNGTQRDMPKDTMGVVQAEIANQRIVQYPALLKEAMPGNPQVKYLNDRFPFHFLDPHNLLTDTNVVLIEQSLRLPPVEHLKHIREIYIEKGIGELADTTGRIYIAIDSDISSSVAQYVFTFTLLHGLGHRFYQDSLDTNPQFAKAWFALADSSGLGKYRYMARELFADDYALLCMQHKASDFFIGKGVSAPDIDVRKTRKAREDFFQKYVFPQLYDAFKKAIEKGMHDGKTSPRQPKKDRPYYDKSIGEILNPQLRTGL